jgi:hypothetical protein
MTIAMSMNADLGRMTILAKLQENRDFVFHLTGSRFFGGDSPCSDWDFFTSDTEAVRDFLWNMGFTRLTNGYGWASYGSYQHDGNTTDVYRHYSGIDIALNRDIEKKKKAQDILFKSDILRTLKLTSASQKQKKQMAREFWNLVYLLLDKTDLEIEDLKREMARISLEQMKNLPVIPSKEEKVPEKNPCGACPEYDTAKKQVFPSSCM